MPEAFSFLKLLNSTTRFDGRVHLVSKCGPVVEERTRSWLIRTNFHRETEIGMDKLHFVRERADKAVICKRLGVTHFVDDRIDVLAKMDSVSHRFLFRREMPLQVPPWVVHVRSWEDLERHLR